MREDETYEDGLWPETEIRRIWYEPSGEQEQDFELCRLWNIEVGGWLAAPCGLAGLLLASRK